ncbi:MAG: hypothetical protein HC875_39380, partial [Anaerolineales bacterium]|nr:hypothetical protein [Anaerolineales bacterium]
MFQGLQLSGIVLCYGPLAAVIFGFIGFALITDKIANRTYLRRLDPRPEAEVVEAPAPVRLRTAIMVWLALAQASLGIVTLVLQVPLPLALAHQAGAAIMLAFAVAHWRAVHGTYA